MERPRRKKAGKDPMEKRAARRRRTPADRRSPRRRTGSRPRAKRRRLLRKRPPAIRQKRAEAKIRESFFAGGLDKMGKLC